MAKLPTVDQLGGRPSVQVDTSVATIGNAGAIGAALGGLGQSVSGVADVYRAEQEKAEAFDTRKREIEFVDGQNMREIERRRTADPSGRGYVAGVVKDYDGEADKFLKTVPERLRPEVATRLAAVRGDMSMRGMEFELNQRDKWYKTEVGKMGDRAQAGILADPDGAADYKKNFDTYVDQTGLPAAEKAELKRKGEELFGQSRIRGLVDAGRDIEAFGAAGGSGDAKAQTKGLLRNFEGFKDGAYWDVNAHRAGYGSDTTTLPDGSVVSVTADTKVSREDAERDLDRRTSEFMGKVRNQVGAATFDALPANVQAGLASVGYNYGSLPENVATAAKTGDPAQIAAAIRARSRDNEGVNAKRRNAEADYILAGTDRMIGDETAAGYTTKLIADRDAKERRLAATEAAQLSAENKAKVNQLELDVLDGKAGLTNVDEARKAGWLTDATDVGRIQAAIKKRDEEALATERVLSGQPLNQFDADDKKAVGDAYTGLIRSGSNPVTALDTIYTKTGILPPDAVQGLRGAVVSVDPKAAEPALQLASSIMVRNPNAFAGYDGGQDIEKNAVAFQHFTERGMSAQEAARRVVEMGSPEYQAKIKAGDKEVTEFTKGITSTDVQDTFGVRGAWYNPISYTPWSNAADVGFTFEQQNAITSEFAEIAGERFRETGDADVSKAYAKSEMAKVYGVTDVSGKRVFMKFPPEKSPAYPPIKTEDGTSSQAYIYEQAAGEASKIAGKEIKPEDVILAYIPNVTSRDWNMGQPPRYQLSYWDRSGDVPRLEVIPSKGFIADPQAAQKPWDDKEGERRTDWDRKAKTTRIIREERQPAPQFWMTGEEMR